MVRIYMKNRRVLLLLKRLRGLKLVEEVEGVEVS